MKYSGGKNKIVNAASGSAGGTELNLGPAEGTIRLRQFSFDPLHDAVIVEDMFTGSFTDHCRRLEVFDANSTTLLILLILGRFVLLFREQFRYQRQLLFVLLLEDALGGDRVVHTVHDQVGIVNDSMCLGSILAEDTEGSATAEAAETERSNHSKQEDVVLI